MYGLLWARYDRSTASLCNTSYSNRHLPQISPLSMFDSLPPELIDRIIEELPSESMQLLRFRHLAGGMPHGPSSLAALSATCRSLRQRVAPILFRNIEFICDLVDLVHPEDLYHIEQDLLFRFQPELLRHAR